MNKIRNKESLLAQEAPCLHAQVADERWANFKADEIFIVFQSETPIMHLNIAFLSMSHIGDAMISLKLLNTSEMISRDEAVLGGLLLLH